MKTYLDSGPDPALFDVLRHDFATLDARHAGVTATSFRGFPSYPQRVLERLSEQPPCDPALADVQVDPWPSARRRHVYTEADLRVRRFTLDTPRRPEPRSITVEAA